MTPPEETPPAGLAGAAMRAGVYLGIRTVSVRAVALVGTLILAWILDPHDFGVFGIVAALVTLMSAFGDVGLGASLIQQPSEPSRRELSTVWTAQMTFAVLGMALIIVIAPLVIGFVPDLPADAVTQVRLLSIGLPLAALRSLPSVMLERSVRYRSIARIEVAGQLVFYVVAIPLAVAGGGSWSLVAVAITQAVVMTVAMNLAWRPRQSVLIDIPVLRRKLGFGIGYQASYAVTWARDGLVPVLVGLTGGPVAAGIVSLAIRIGLIAAAFEDIVARLTLPTLSRVQAMPGTMWRGFGEARSLSLILISPLQLWFSVGAPTLLPLVLSAQWADVVLPAQLIALSLILRVPARVLRQAAFASGRVKMGVLLALVGGIVPLGFVALLTPGGGVNGAALGILVGAALALGLTILASPHRTALEPRRTTTIVGIAAVAAAVSAVVLRALTGPAAVAVSGIAMGVAYIPLIWQVERASLVRAASAVLARRASPT